MHGLIGPCVVGIPRETDSDFVNHPVKISIVEVNVNAQRKPSRSFINLIAMIDRQRVA